MTLNTEESPRFISDFDINTLVSDYLKANVEREVMQCLKQGDTASRLLGAIIHSRYGRLVTEEDAARVNRAEDKVRALLNLLKRKCFTVNMICLCAVGQHLASLFQALRVSMVAYVVSDVPGRVACSRGSEVKVTFHVDGYPSPCYQWYHRNEPLSATDSPTLVLTDFREAMEGEYRCEVTQTLPGKGVKIKLESGMSVAMLLEEPGVILMDLQPRAVCRQGEDVTLGITPGDSFCGRFDWLHGNKVIAEVNSPSITIRNVRLADAGVYKCILTNRAGETHSNVCTLRVEPPLLRPWHKAALLVGNSSYRSLSPLQSPGRDVSLLSSCLSNLGFKVSSYFDLTKLNLDNKINMFLASLPERSFVLVYLSGHGFEVCNNKFFMPVDCPPSGEYSALEHCTSYEWLVKQAMLTRPLLLVSVLDMCLIAPDQERNPQIYEESLKHHGYRKAAHSCLVEACATSDYQAAYEDRSPASASYAACLSNHLLRDLPVHDIFNSAHQDFVKLGRQSPQLKYVYGKHECRQLRLGMETWRR